MSSGSAGRLLFNQDKISRGKKLGCSGVETRVVGWIRPSPIGTSGYFYADRLYEDNKFGADNSALLSCLRHTYENKGTL